MAAVAIVVVCVLAVAAVRTETLPSIGFRTEWSPLFHGQHLATFGGFAGLECAVATAFLLRFGNSERKGLRTVRNYLKRRIWLPG